MKEMQQKGEEEGVFNEKRRNYFFRLARRYENLFNLHRLSGQTKRNVSFGEDVQINKAGESFKRAKRWGNPTEHCLVEAAAAEILAEKLKLTQEEADSLTAAAFIHDWRKKGEIEETKGVKDPVLIEQSYAKSKTELLAHGIDGEVVALTECVAHTSLPKFATLNQDGSISLKENVGIVEMAMHYVDDITRGDDLVSIDERMDYLDSVASTRYPYNEAGRAVWGGRTFFQAQREIDHLIEALLAKQCGIEDPKLLPRLLKEELNRKIMTS